MTSYVSDLLINPVLRQARRFSKPSAPDEQAGPSVGDRSESAVEDSARHEVAVKDIVERMESMDQSGEEALSGEGRQTISGELLTSSPVEEIGGLEAELEALEAAASSSAPSILDPSYILPLRVDSLRSEGGQHDDSSENPLFGIPRRFRTGSGTSFTEQSVLSARMSPAEGPSRSSTQDLSHSGSISRQRNSSLPEDDGMSALRRQIVTIQAMDAPAERKAQMMHQLLTQGYSQAQQIYQAKHQVPAPSAVDMVSQERPNVGGSLSSYLWQMNGDSDDTPRETQHTFHLSPSDLERTYAPLDSPDVDDDGNVHPKEEQIPELGCRHYKRNVKLQCSTCDRWYTCRMCHDEVETHVLIRKETKNMLCMLCGCAQIAGEDCVECGERTAWYYCDVCKLWDNDPSKNIYHCNDCGICRKGRGLGKDFFHCQTCGVCITMAVEHSHKCIERVSDCDCPICGEYMFDSPRPVVFMLCGHSIHQTCYYEHMKTSYKCPICSKSTVNMETQFRNLDRAIDSQPMPPQFQDTKAMVSCNDCYAKSAVKYHWLGLKCAICDSYNTAQLSILSDPAVEVPSIEPRAAEQIEPPAQIPWERAPLGPTSSGPIRFRRHSSHLHIPATTSGETSRFAPYPPNQRIGRSVSPIRTMGFFGHSPVTNDDTDDAEEVDDLDFWGRDEPRSITSLENNLEDMEMEEEFEDSDDEDDSGLDDCDEDGDEEDRFELLGHR